jgi:hypothetical protein
LGYRSMYKILFIYIYIYIDEWDIGGILKWPSYSLVIKKWASWKIP